MKISDNRIVCPASVWVYWYPEPYPSQCTEVSCCYLCKRQRECTFSGCSKACISNYPFDCKTYPLTFKEAKRILAFLRIFRKEEDTDYVKFLIEVTNYMEGKKKLDKEKKEQGKKTRR